MTPLTVLRPRALPERPSENRWLVENLWTDRSVGLIGGAPKSLLCRTRHKRLHAASLVMPRGSASRSGCRAGYYLLQIAPRSRRGIIIGSRGRP
jgi:hypothetical protein